MVSSVVVWTVLFAFTVSPQLDAPNYFYNIVDVHSRNEPRRDFDIRVNSDQTIFQELLDENNSDSGNIIKYPRAIFIKTKILFMCNWLAFFILF